MERGHLMCIYIIWVPGDSSPSSPIVGGHQTFEGVTDHHPKQGTKNCQVQDSLL